MAGYDDANVIEAVLGMMARDPGLSRRQAIIQVTGGDEQLRRIEIKMKDAEDEHGKGVPLRRAIAEVHAERFPMSLDEADEGCVFGYEGCDLAHSGTVGLAAGRSGKSLAFVATRGSAGQARASRRAVGGDSLDFFAVDQRRASDADVRGNLADLGLLCAVASGVLVDGVNHVALGLADSLAARWEAHGFPAGEHMGEAVAHETARMEACGLGKLREAIGADGLQLMSRSTDDRTVSLVGSRKERSRVAMLAAAGGLAGIVAGAEGTDHREALREALIDRHVHMDVGMRHPGEDEVASFVATFSDRRLAPVTDDVVDKLLWELPHLDLGRLPDTASKAALARFLGNVDDDIGALQALAAFRDADRSYGEALAFAAGMSAGEVRMRMAEYVDFLLAASLSAARARDPKHAQALWFPDGAEDAARRALATPLTAEDGFALAMRWRAAGRPGRVGDRRGGGAGWEAPDVAALERFLAGEGRSLPVVEPEAVRLSPAANTSRVREAFEVGACLLTVGSVAGVVCAFVLMAFGR